MATTLKLGTDNNWAVKEGSLLAYNDQNNNFKPLPFDFTRNSSATRVNEQGLIETVGVGVPRIDFTDGKGSLLLEPTRSNLVEYSEDFSNVAWNASSTRSVDFVPTNTIDPQGKTSAYKVTSTAPDNQVAYLANIVSGQTYTSSIYVKRVSGSGNIILRNVNNQQNNFQVSVSDGWKRIQTTVSSTSTFGRLYINLETIGDEIEIWGAQVEQGSYATSYIPTSGSAATRNADVCTNGGNEQVINSTEGVLFLELKALANDGTSRYISINDGTTSNRVNIFYDNNNVLRGFVTGISSMPSSATITNNNKIAFKYKSGDVALWINGVEVATKTDLISLSGLKSVSFDQTGGLNWYGTCKNMKIYNTALTDQQLIELTTI